MQFSSYLNNTIIIEGLNCENLTVYSYAFIIEE